MTAAREFWNKSADNYDKTEERFDVIHRRSRELAKGHLNETDLVLDYGCGTGTTACELAGQVREIRGIDISDKMIELAEMKAAAGDVPNVTFSQGDIFDKDLAPGSFDAILAFNMLHTLPDPESVMKPRSHRLSDVEVWRVVAEARQALGAPSSGAYSRWRHRTKPTPPSESTLLVRTGRKWSELFPER